MHSDRAFTESVDYAERTIAFLKENGIAHTPENFTLGYQLMESTYPELVEKIKLALEQDGTLLQHTSETLYKGYIESVYGPSAETMNKKIESIIRELVLNVTTIINQKSGQQNRLTHVKSEIIELAPEGSLARLANQLVECINEVTESEIQLQDELNEAQTEIKDLQTELKKTKKESNTDGLTGLLNRRNFDMSISQACQEAKTANDLALLMIDLDHFKRINDEFGHPTGDKLLRWTAKSLDGVLGSYGRVYRYGGEEFAAIIHKQSPTAIQNLADQMRRYMQKQKLKSSDQNKILDNVTISIGIAFYKPSEKTDQLINRADQALYQAKTEGRDRVIIAK